MAYFLWRGRASCPRPRNVCQRLGGGWVGFVLRAYSPMNAGQLVQVPVVHAGGEGGLRVGQALRDERCVRVDDLRDAHRVRVEAILVVENEVDVVVHAGVWVNQKIKESIKRFLFELKKKNASPVIL